MKLCLVIAEDAEKRTSLCEMIEELGFVPLEAPNWNSAYLTAHGLLPDLIVFGDSVDPEANSELVKNLKVFKNGKKPLILFAEQPDIVDFARRLGQHNLLEEPVRRAMGV